MPKRGGYRVGAGRPRGSKNITLKTIDMEVLQRGDPKAPRGMKPLAYMLAVMNDDTADAARRDRMAIAACPYCHPRADAVLGKKDRAREAAQTAGEGTAWGNDLETLN
jgi:hypothetical protein